MPSLRICEFGSESKARRVRRVANSAPSLVVRSNKATPFGVVESEPTRRKKMTRCSIHHNGRQHVGRAIVTESPVPGRKVVDFIPNSPIAYRGNAPDFCRQIRAGVAEGPRVLLRGLGRIEALLDRAADDGRTGW